MRASLPAFLVAAMLLLPACGGPLRVSYDREHCYIDGAPAALSEVESQQSRIGAHVQKRQPIQTGVTLLMLLLAGAGYLDKLAVLIAARRSSAPSFGERVRAALERHRPHPVRYFAIVTAGLVLIVIGAGLYLYLDADKRASERALQQLQFCQLALKSAAEQDSLDEQRKNLDALAATAGDIKSLVDGLPPEAQRKAEVVLGQMHVALGNQSRMLTRETEVAAAVASGSAQIEHQFGLIHSEMGGLLPLPQRLHEMAELLARLDARTRLDDSGEKGPAPPNLGAALVDVRKKTDELGERLLQNDCAKARLPSGKTVGETLVELAARPATCRCECVGAVAAAGTAGPTGSAATTGTAPGKPAPGKPDGGAR